jgi:hypothetical protein
VAPVRDGVRGKVHPGEGSGEGAPAGEAGSLHAVGSSGGRGPGGFWVCAGEGFLISHENNSTQRRVLSGR